MAGFEGIVNPNQLQDGKSVDGKKISIDGKTAPKEAPSLFDSMLAQVTGKGTNSSEAEGEEGSSNQKQTTSQNSNGSKANASNINNSNVSNTTINSNSGQNSGASLFDKMVSESNKQAQTASTQNNIANANTGTQVTGVNIAQKATQNKMAGNTEKGTQTYTVSPQSMEETSVETKKGVAEVGKTSVSNTTNNIVNQSTQKNSTQTSTTTNVPNTQNQTKAQNQISGTAQIKETKTQTNQIASNTETTNLQKQSSTAVAGNEAIKVQKQTNAQSSTSQIKQTDTVPTQTQNNVQKQTSNRVDSKQNIKTEKTTNTSEAQNLQNTNTSSLTKQSTKNVQTSTSQTKNNIQNINNQTSNVDEKKVSTVASTTGAIVAKKVKDTNTQSTKIATSEKANLVQGDVKSGVKVETETLETSSVKNTKSSSSPVNSQTQTTSSLNKEKTTNNAISNKKAQQNLVDSKVDNTNQEGVKKSLADNLISTATATALADKAINESKDGSKSITNNTVSTQNTKTTTPIQNNTTPVNLSSSESSQSSLQSVDTTSSNASVQEIKTTEQNVVDRKVETKNIDLKSSDKKQELLKNEKDHSLKTVGVSSLTSASINTSNATNTTPNSNQDLASGLASIRDTAKSDVSTINNDSLKSTLKESMKKEDNLLSDKKQQNANSLLDKMMKEASTTNSSEGKLASESLGAKDQFVQKDLPLFATAGYLHDQKKRNDIANMIKKSEGVKQAQDAKNVGDIKNSAQTLGLNATETEVIEDVVQKEEVRVQNSRDDLLKRMAFDNNVGRKLHNTNNQIQMNENIVAKSAALTNTTEEQVVEVAVSAEATQTIENRIIGARQSLRSMMSDVARQMAQNYKPPLTAFRINLNPNGLGNIAVMIKSEQNNGISISLNMSNTNTLETFVDNQSQLRAALTRNFDSATNFNLDFGMQQDSGSNQNQNDGSNQNQNRSNSAEQTNNIIAEQHTTEEVIAQSNYM